MKARPGAPPEYFQREAEGLRWLAVNGGAPVVTVLAVGPDRLELQRLAPGTATVSSAAAFGRELAVTHQAGAPAYGSPPPSTLVSNDGFLADVALPFGSWPSFGRFYAEARVLPYLERLPTLRTQPVFTRLIAGLLTDDERLVGPPEPPSRIHGDLWSGNVVWNRDDGRAWLIDPAAHGGHRETDLAMLALFGAPHLESIRRGYEEVHPLAPGWRARVALHQLHPLLVHSVMFGGGYLAQSVAAATAALTTLDDS